MSIKPIVLIKFTPDGTHLWTSIIDSPDTHEHPYFVMPTPQDGGYILAGMKQYNNNFPNGQFYVLKVDSLGQKQWDSIYGSNVRGKAFQIIPSPQNDGYIVSGGLCTNPNDENSSDNYAAKIGFDGSLIWGKLWGTNESDDAIQINPTQNPLEYVGFSTLYDYASLQWFLKFNENFDTIYIKTFSLPNHEAFGSNVLVTPENEFLIISSCANDVGGRFSQLVKFSNMGDILWIKQFPDLNPKDDYYLQDIEPTPDGGYILAGFNYSQQYAWLVKIDSLGQTCSYMGCDSIGTLNCVGQISKPVANFTTQINEQALYLQNKSLYVYPDSLNGGHYIWDFGDGTPPFITQDPSPFTHYYTNPGYYNLTLMATVCGDTSTKQQTIVTNCYGQPNKPEAKFTITPTANEKKIWLYNESLYVFADSTDGGYYHWIFGDGTSPNITAKDEPFQHTYKNHGNYQITLYAIVCGDTSVSQQWVAIEVVGIENSPPWGGSSRALGGVTPNPAHQTATLTLNPNYTHLIHQGETLEIFNTQGQLVKTVPLSGLETTTFTTANLISGIYYCRLQNHPDIEGVKFLLY